MGLIKPTVRTRDLTLPQLFEILQEEYIVCELRVKIYPYEKHRGYWSDTMRKKKEKIIDIAKKNSFFSIFDDIRIKQEFWRRIVPEFGYPKFIYRDAKQQFIQEKWDLHNYYLPNSEVKVVAEGGKILIGVLTSVDFSKKEVIVKLENQKSQVFDIGLVTRILT